MHKSQSQGHHFKSISSNISNEFELFRTTVDDVYKS